DQLHWIPGGPGREHAKVAGPAACRGRPIRANGDHQITRSPDHAIFPFGGFSAWLRAASAVRESRYTAPTSWPTFFFVSTGKVPATPTVPKKCSPICTKKAIRFA